MRVLTVLAASWLAFSLAFSADDRSFFHGAPVRTTYPNAITLLDSGAFVVGYDEARRVPVWAAYRLFPNPNTFDFDRPSGFRIDNRTQARISHDDYTNSGFSRGHMAPNFAIMTRYGLEAQRATFLMSNVVPQRQALNGGPWENLESRIARDFANTLEEIWVVTGPIFDSVSETIPGTGVEIPDRFYKIVADEDNGQPRALAFIMEEDTTSPATLTTFLVSVNTVQTAAGLNFFAGLDDTVEAALESAMPTALWTTSGAPPLPDPSASGLINVNTAPSEDLENLPGIGPVLAQWIIEARPFSSVDDLRRVTGIGPATVERLRPLVRVQ